MALLGPRARPFAEIWFHTDQFLSRNVVLFIQPLGRYARIHLPHILMILDIISWQKSFKVEFRIPCIQKY